MDKDQLAALREQYDNNSTVSQMGDGTWETEVAPDPMVTTSLRLPKSELDWVREQAAEAGVKPTALIRRWIEERHRVNSASGEVSECVTQLSNAFGIPRFASAEGNLDEVYRVLGQQVQAITLQSLLPAGQLLAIQQFKLPSFVGAQDAMQDVRALLERLEHMVSDQSERLDRIVGVAPTKEEATEEAREHLRASS